MTKLAMELIDDMVFTLLKQDKSFLALVAQDSRTNQINALVNGRPVLALYDDKKYYHVTLKLDQKSNIIIEKTEIGA